MPVTDLSLPNLQYLTTKQVFHCHVSFIYILKALEDLAYFIYYFSHNVLNNTNSPWITFGCSYAGALAGFFYYEKFLQFV